MTIRQAACNCGQLQVETRGEPARVSVCHCLACQRRTGSAFGLQARFDTGQTTVSGNSKVWERISDEGNAIDFHFCPECGATVYFQIRQMPEVMAIAAGAFADPGFPSPSFSVYEERKHAWVDIPGEVEHWD